VEWGGHGGDDKSLGRAFYRATYAEKAHRALFLLYYRPTKDMRTFRAGAKRQEPLTTW
jgi:hypothetical protein